MIQDIDVMVNDDMKDEDDKEIEKIESAKDAEVDTVIENNVNIDNFEEDTFDIDNVQDDMQVGDYIEDRKEKYNEKSKTVLAQRRKKNIGFGVASLIGVIATITAAIALSIPVAIAVSGMAIATMVEWNRQSRILRDRAKIYEKLANHLEKLENNLDSIDFMDSSNIMAERVNKRLHKLLDSEQKVRNKCNGAELMKNFISLFAVLGVVFMPITGIIGAMISPALALLSIISSDAAVRECNKFNRNYYTAHKCFDDCFVKSCSECSDSNDVIEEEKTIADDTGMADAKAKDVKYSAEDERVVDEYVENLANNPVQEESPIQKVKS